MLCPRQVRLDYMPGAGVCYTCTVAVRYDPLCTLLQDTQTWRIGTHTLGGVEGLIGGYQLVHWKRPPGELVYARATDLSCIIKNVSNALANCSRGMEGLAGHAEELQAGSCCGG